MSGYKPKVAIAIPKPCSESWESMPGDARVRHCGACGRDVHNLAVMTPAQIDALLTKPGPLPCMRVVRHQDGSLMTARIEQKAGVMRRASMALSTVMLMTGGAAAQTAKTSKPTPIASLKGQIVDATGAPIAHAKVELRIDGKQIVTADTDAKGAFVMQAQPGAYTFDAWSTGFERSPATPLQLREGMQQVAKPVSLNVTALMGDVVVTSESAEMPTQNGTVGASIPYTKAAPKTSKKTQTPTER